MKENLRVRRISAVVKDKKIEFDEYYLIDLTTGEEIFDRDIEIENDIRLYDLYKSQEGLLTTTDIKNIRNKYQMNQKEFSKVLGLGEITIHRFENGSIQTGAVDSIIRLSKDPDIMSDFLLKNKDSFEEEEYQRLEAIIHRLKSLKNHRIAKFNFAEITKLEFSTIKVDDVVKKLIIKYNKQIEALSMEYKIIDMSYVAEYITPLKIQKLLYYIQGLSAVIFNKPAFNDGIYAWSYGPVVESIYKKYKGRAPISSPKDDIKISAGLDKIIDIVISSYGQIEAGNLIDLTHSEEPWKNTKRNQIIDFELIRNYFKEVYSN